jgi:oligosaccharyltransferase complex subunit gamma
LEYINKKTERDIQHIVPISGVLLTLSVIASFIGLVFILFKYFKFFFLSPKVWFVGSITIYAICSAGVIYNILHGVPLTTTDRHGNTEFFSTQNRTQLGAEGFIMSIAICSVGVLIILWNKLFKISWNTMVKRIVYMVLFGATILVVLFIEDVYRK